MSPPRPGALPRVCRRDFFLPGYLPAMALIAWLSPEAAWPSICGAAARLSGARRGRGAGARRIERLLGCTAAEAERIATEVAASSHLARLQLLRCHRAGAWRPRLDLAGEEHVREALTAGKGAILWIAPFVFADLVAKMTLHQAGLAVTHLSRAGHGLSPSRVGERLFNPIVTSIEGRFLAERVVMTAERTAGALRDLIRRVRDNRVVSISVNPVGERRHTAPFLRGTMAIADGAPALARRSGAALLPVFTIRSGGGFLTTVEPPLRVEADCEVQEAAARLIAACARRVEAYAVQWPGQYGGWPYAVATDGE